MRATDPPERYSMDFQLVSDYKPMGDQIQAIDQLAKGVAAGDREQILLGVTGSGKTFTIANVIEKINRPTLVLAHNKILASQLCTEFKELCSLIKNVLIVCHCILKAIFGWNSQI